MLIVNCDAEGQSDSADARIDDHDMNCFWREPGDRFTQIVSRMGDILRRYFVREIDQIYLRTSGEDDAFHSSDIG